MDFTLGPASAKSGFFDLASFTVTQNGGFCGVCSPLSETLSGALVDASTLGVVGSITGTYSNSKGKVHTYDLTTTDLPAGTWTFGDSGPGGVTQTSKGTYSVVASTTGVDEPGTLLLLIPAGVALLISLRRRPGNWARRTG